MLDIAVENGAATPNLFGPNGDQLDAEVQSGDLLPDEIWDFVGLANAHAAGEKASDRAKAVKP
ncbi:hypothetical protein ACVWWJ_001590 [Luteibacter sp. HA06]